MSFIKRAAAVLFAAVIVSGQAAAPLTGFAYGSPRTKTAVSITAPSFRKLSSKKIRIYWSGSKDDKVSKYLIQRSNAGGSPWKTIAVVNSDRNRSNGKNYYTDKLKSSAPVRYRYRINVSVADSLKYKSVAGKAIYASNVKVCIDPGHYLDVNAGSYGYKEAHAALRIGLELNSQLKQRGIDVYMTRSDKNITVGGEVNTDSGDQLFERGRIAGDKKCDLFISLHTNANSENANDCDTLNQPKQINKVLVFINQTAYKQKSRSARKIANYIGTYATKVNKNHGFYCSGWQRGSVPTVYANDDNFIRYNDSLRKKGKIIYRKWGGKDYYAVLRGASSVGVPGLLVEHSYHTYADFCKTFMNDPSLAKDLADVEADAMLKYLF